MPLSARTDRPEKIGSGIIPKESYLTGDLKQQPPTSSQGEEMEYIPYQSVHILDGEQFGFGAWDIWLGLPNKSKGIDYSVLKVTHRREQDGVVFFDGCTLTLGETTRVIRSLKEFYVL